MILWVIRGVKVEGGGRHSKVGSAGRTTGTGPDVADPTYREFCSKSDFAILPHALPGLVDIEAESSMVRAKEKISGHFRMAEKRPSDVVLTANPTSSLHTVLSGKRSQQEGVISTRQDRCRRCQSNRIPCRKMGDRGMR